MKGIFGNLFFYFKPKNEFRNFEFCFSSFFWNRLHQNLFWLFWEVGSKIELKLLYHWIKLFKTFTIVGWRLNVNIISMYKIDFYFFVSYCKRILLSEIRENLKENYPNVRRFSVPTIKKFCKENDLPSRFFQNHVIC